MGRYTIRFPATADDPVVIGTTFIIYAMVWALPGDPFVGKCGDRPCPAGTMSRCGPSSTSTICPVQYGSTWNLLQGNFGESFSDALCGQITQAFPRHLPTGLIAIIEIVIGISAVSGNPQPGGFWDNLILVSTLIVISIPVFVIGFSPVGSPSASNWPGSRRRSGRTRPYMVNLLPSCWRRCPSLAYVARLMRSLTGEPAAPDYADRHLQRGLSRRRVIGRHAVRNS